MSPNQKKFSFVATLTVAGCVGGIALTGTRQAALAQATAPPATGEATAPPATAPAAETPPAATPPKIDADASALMTQMAAAYKALSSYSATADFSSTGLPNGPSGHSTVAYKKPNRVAVVTTKSGHSMRLIANGTNIFGTSSTDKAHYLKQPIPAGSSVIAGVIAQGGAGGAGLMPLLITGADPVEPLRKQIKSLSLGTPGTVAGIPVETVIADLSRDEKTPVTLTFSIGKDDHLLRQLSIAQSVEGKPITLIETYSAVKINPVLPASTFVFTPVAGAKPLDNSEPAAYDPRLKPGTKPFPIVAKDLSGKAVSLDQYRGKVVLLDFWAMWCGPCVGELPNVVNAYNKFKDKGFDVLGVSLDMATDREKLISFTGENKMPWRQILDGNAWQGRLVGLYKVQAIPFSLLIDREGKIAAISPRGPELEPAVQAALAKK